MTAYGDSAPTWARTIRLAPRPPPVHRDTRVSPTLTSPPAHPLDLPSFVTLPQSQSRRAVPLCILQANDQCALLTPSSGLIPLSTSNNPLTLARRVN